METQKVAFHSQLVAEFENIEGFFYKKFLLNL
jgi:hypothetical protein